METSNRAGPELTKVKGVSYLFKSEKIVGWLDI